MANANDRSVLQAILNPLIPLSDDYDQDVEEDNACPKSITALEAQARSLEEEGIQLAEKGNVGKALDKMNEVIALNDQRVSGYNNRAQIYRLMHNNAAARVDLDRAISLAHAQHEGVDKPNRAAGQAYTQRAMLCRLERNDEGAKEDFEKAASNGCTFAKTQLIAMNPYAAMCNKMLHDVMGKLARGEPEDDTDRGA